MNINIGILQILPSQLQEENLKKGIDACRKVKVKGADIIVFPEMWNIGYEISQDPQELNKKAIDINSPFIENFRYYRHSKIKHKLIKNWSLKMNKLKHVLLRVNSLK